MVARRRGVSDEPLRSGTFSERSDCGIRRIARMRRPHLRSTARPRLTLLSLRLPPRPSLRLSLFPSKSPSTRLTTAALCIATATAAAIATAQRVATARTPTAVARAAEVAICTSEIATSALGRDLSRDLPCHLLDISRGRCERYWLGVNTSERCGNLWDGPGRGVRRHGVLTLQGVDASRWVQGVNTAGV